MGMTARSRLMTFLPWLALVAVTLFAFAQVRARREHEARSGTQAAPVAAPVAAPAAASGADGPVAFATGTPPLQAAETALDDALQALDAAGARATALEAEAAAATKRAETAEARLDVSLARLRAAEADLDGAAAEAERLERDLAPLLERVASLEARRKVVEDRVLRTLADAVTEDPERQRRARATAGRLGAEDLTRLAALIREDAARAESAASLFASIPPSEEADAVGLAILESLDVDDDAAARFEGLGRDHLLRPAFLTALLGQAEAGAWHPVLIEWLGRNASGFDAEAREALAQPLISRMLGDDTAKRARAMRLLGILRQDGQATAIVSSLASGASAVRAAAAYALSRVPDAESVKDEAWKAVPGLLADASLDVRTAGTLLAESILGHAIAFDPAADEATRAKQLGALPAQP